MKLRHLSGIIMWSATIWVMFYAWHMTEPWAWFPILVTGVAVEVGIGVLFFTED